MTNLDEALGEPAVPSRHEALARLTETAINLDLITPKPKVVITPGARAGMTPQGATLVETAYSNPEDISGPAFIISDKDS